MFIRLRFCVSALVCAMLASATVDASVFHGRVDRVIDGDTIKVITEDTQLRVRIRGIDAPESDQEYGPEATLALTQLIDGRNVTLISEEVDQYGRMVASVAVSNQDVGLYMLENGFAWYYRAYGARIPPEWQDAYREAETNAKGNRIGLWASNHGAIPPWSWRKQKRDSDQAARVQERESIEGVTEDLRNNIRELGDNFLSLKKKYFSDSEDETPDGEGEPEEEKEANWWDLFIKLGEDFSRWLMAYISSFFGALRS